MFEGMMMRFQEDTARHLFRMQIIGPDGTPIESAEQLANAQAQVAAAAAQAQFQQDLAPARPASGPPAHTNAPAARQPTPTPVSNRPPSTTIDASSADFKTKKKRKLKK